MLVTTSPLHTLLDRELQHALDYRSASEAVAALPAPDGAFSSHLAMALHALAALGAPAQRLQAWADSTFAQVPARPAWPALDAAADAFAQQLAEQPAGSLLARRLPVLLTDCGAAAFHALIRCAHAWESGHRGQLALALAYWGAHHQALPGPAEVAGEALAVSDWLAALRALPPAAPAPWIVLRLRQVAARPDVQQLAPRLRLEPGVLHRLAQWAAGAYARSGHFTLLHLVTASRAMAVLLPLLPAPARPSALRHFSRAWAAGLLAARWDGVEQALPPLQDWATLRTAAFAHEDAHTLKAVHAAWHFGRLDTDPLWRQAAARALVTAH